MELWTTFLDLLQSLLFATTQLWGGSVGFGIITLSLVFRLLLLPLTYAIARDGYQRALGMRRLQPHLRRLQERYGEDPARLAQEQLKLYRHYGVKLIEPRSLLGGLLQLPLFAGMYTAIRRVLASGLGGRWLWVPDVARPDAWLALLVAGLVGATVMLAPQASPQFSRWLLVLPAAVVTGVMLLKLSAGMGLYWGASSVVGIVQAVLVRRGVSGRAAV